MSRQHAKATSGWILVALSCFDKWHKFVECLILAQTPDEKHSPVFIPYLMCQKVSQRAVSKPTHDPHDTQTDAHAAPMLRFQMCSGFSLWWNPSPSEGLSNPGLLISGLNVSMGECDITSTCCFWQTHMCSEEHPELNLEPMCLN